MLFSKFNQFDWIVLTNQTYNLNILHQPLAPSIKDLFYPVIGA